MVPTYRSGSESCKHVHIAFCEGLWNLSRPFTLSISDYSLAGVTSDDFFGLIKVSRFSTHKWPHKQRVLQILNDGSSEKVACMEQAPCVQWRAQQADAKGHVVRSTYRPSTYFHYRLLLRSDGRPRTCGMAQIGSSHQPHDMSRNKFPNPHTRQDAASVPKQYCKLDGQVMQAPYHSGL